MTTIEFMTDLTSEPILTIPEDAARQLPKSGRARIFIVTEPAVTGDIVVGSPLESRGSKITNAQLLRLAEVSPPPAEWFEGDAEKPF